MKIAKKLLAAVVAVMLVCTLAVSAFAATPADAKIDIVVKSWEPDEYNSITLDVYFVGAVGLEAWTFDLVYDKAIFNIKGEDVVNGVDASEAEKAKAVNPMLSAVNALEDGKLIHGGTFGENLWDSDTWAKKAGRGQTITVNADNFHIATIYLTVEDAAALAAGTEITATGEYDFGAAGKVAVSDKVANAAEKPTEAPTDAPTDAPTEKPTEKPTEAPTQAPTEEPSSIDTSRPVDDKPIKPGERPTGDSAALAAAAGVVLLAGAAFVVSKKRK